MSDRFMNLPIKKRIFPLSLISLLLMSDAAYAGSWWDVNGQQVYVPRRARHAMKDALSSAREKGMQTPSGEVPSLGGGMNIACEAVICLKQYISPAGENGGPACAPSKEAYFSIRVIYPPRGFDEGLTSAARQIFLSLCPIGADTNQAIIQAENAAVGWRLEAPD